MNNDDIDAAPRSSKQNASLFMDSGVIYDLISSLTYYILDKERRTPHRAFSLARPSHR